MKTEPHRPELHLPELHRPVALDRIGPRGLAVTLDATAAECAALAVRLGIPAVASFRCSFTLTEAGGGAVDARGHLQAGVVQTCVISLDEFEAEVDEIFSVRFVPEGTEEDGSDPESEDEIPYSGAVLDLGEAAAEELALALDPYPRKPDAELPTTEGGEPAHPFARLASLRRPS